MPSEKTLGDFLSEKTIDHPHNGDNYLTLQCLRHLLTKPKVEENLDKYREQSSRRNYTPNNPNGHYVQLICPNSQAAEDKTYIRLFATLATAEIGWLIFQFMDNGISDQDLPMAPPKDSSSTRLDNAFPQNIRRMNMDSFRIWKWKMNVPILTYRRHMVLDQSVILPFIERTRSNPRTQTHTKDVGGYGEVSYLKIHKHGHDFPKIPQVTSPEGPFALKRISRGGYGTTEGRRNREANMLERFSPDVHAHILTVLATYEHGDSHYIIFPWAKCDLDKYLKENNNRSKDLAEKLEKVRWVAEQCLKITGAVHSIHIPRQNNEQQEEQLFGRHGDIKAENILVFGSEGQRPMLVLSDFGLASVHHDWSKSNVPNQDLPVTTDVRPPECDMRGGTITRAFDIWTLGCLFLDLLIWLLEGEKSRKKFKGKRKTRWFGGYTTSIYFEIVKHSETGKIGFIVKPVVTEWVATMHSHPRCTQFLHDFLDLIEQEMLIVGTESKKRMKTNGLLEKLNELYVKCTRNEDYCTNGVPQQHRRTDTELLIAEAQLNDNILDLLQQPSAHLRTVSGRMERAEQTRERYDTITIQMPSKS
ncbi:kinase-like domain-containing protein [Daldinia loculata]|nr:kinase-like domain-containing protein [Daldinia loculata]